MRDPSSEEMKVSTEAVLAAYLNTAKNNLFIIINDVSKSLGLGFHDKNDNILNAALFKHLSNSNSPDVQLQIINKLNRCIPALKDLAIKHANDARNNNEENNNVQEVTTPGSTDYSEIFKKYIRLVLDYRNFYSHAEHDIVTVEKSIIKGLEMLFDKSRRTVKERFNLPENEVQHLVRLGKDKKEAPGFKYSFWADQGTGISQKGFLFFVSLFLEKKDAQEMLKKHTGFKRSDQVHQKATLETFTIYCLKPPKNRLRSESQEDAIVLDMFNELSKCPNELFETLSKEDKSKFIKLDDQPSDDNEYSSLPILRRSGNRFYYFGLKYLEEKLNGIKFQIDLGDYCYHTYNQTINGIDHKRKYIKKVTSFGKLAEFSPDNRPEKWGEMIQTIDTLNTSPKDVYITDTFPHFHINGQNIGITFTDAIKPVNKWGDLPTYDSDRKQPKRNNIIPHCWLSLYELPAIIFYDLIKNNAAPEKGYKSVEEIIKNYYNNLRKFFSYIVKSNINTEEDFERTLAEYNLNKKDIPKAIINHYRTHSQNRNNGLSSYDSILEETKKRLKKAENLRKGTYKINEKGNKIILRPNNKNYNEVKPGKIADFLARDMILFQKPDPDSKNNGKANPVEFKLLQAGLAFFDDRKETSRLYAILKKCNLIGSHNPHPFIDDKIINNSKSLLEFYIEYLKRKEDYLEKHKTDIHFLHKDKMALNNLVDKLINKYRDKDYTIFNLPRGLFLEPIKEILKNEYNKNFDSISSASYIIEKYFTDEVKDTPQEFYNYKRIYRILNKLNNENDKGHSIQEMAADKDKFIKNIPVLCRKNARNNKCDFTPNECAEKLNSTNCKYLKEFKEYLENEKQIRLHKTCDMVLFLILQEYLSTLHGYAIEAKEFRLEDILPTNDKYLSKTVNNVKLTIGTKTIVKDSIKIKNYGDFRTIINDRRLEKLFKYKASDEIEYDEIKEEFEKYDKARRTVFEKIINFEKFVIAKLEIGKDGGKYINHKKILENLQNQNLNGINAGIYEEIGTIRNAFCHSEYPDPDKLKLSIDKYNPGESSVAEGLLKMIGDDYDAIMSVL